MLGKPVSVGLVFLRIWAVSLIAIRYQDRCYLVADVSCPSHDIRLVQ